MPVYNAQAFRKAFNNLECSWLLYFAFYWVYKYFDYFSGVNMPSDA